MLIRRETPDRIPAIRAVTAAAFTASGPPDENGVEPALVDALRAGDAWVPALSLVAVDGADQVIGHVVCTRAHVAAVEVLGLGPLSVHPEHQRRGVGRALMHAVLGAADALDEPLVALLGDPRYYSRFGFRLAGDYGITPPVPGWAPHFQVRTLHAFVPAIRGGFTYAAPFPLG